MAQSTYTGKPDQISELKDKATEQLGRAAERAESVANRMAGQSREAGERIQDVAGNFKAHSTSRSGISPWPPSRLRP